MEIIKLHASSNKLIFIYSLNIHLFEFEYDLTTLNGDENKWESIKNECDKVKNEFNKILRKYEYQIMCKKKLKFETNINKIVLFY